MKTANQINFLAALQITYADLFATDPAYAYSASKCTPEEMGEKMIAAAMAGSASVTGPGFRHACNAVGIAHTKGAIDSFLGVERAAPKPAAKPRKVVTLALSNITTMMTGVSRIDRAHDLVTLTYSDGNREAAKISTARWNEIHENPIAIVSDVQAQRVPTA